MALHLHIDSGLVSAFYFVFLDLILFTSLDTALSRALSHFYYSRIHRGHPIRLRSVDIPGITTFLVGRLLSPINVTALLVKLFFVGCVLMLDLNIKAAVLRHKDNMRLLSTFEMNMTEEAWADGVKVKRNVERRWDAARNCFVEADRSEYRIGGKDEDNARFNDSVMYYHIAFNLTNGFEFTQDETLPVTNLSKLYGNNSNSRRRSPSIPINDFTLHCLRPGHVKEPRPLIRVLGCSTFDRALNTSCAAHARTSRPATSLSFSVSFSDFFKDRNQSGYTYRSETYQFDTLSELQPVFPEYVGPNKRTKLFCLKQGYTIRRVRTWPQIRIWCLLVMRHNGTTLFERWTYHRDTNSMNRTFAGPIFDRDMAVGSWQMANFAWNSQIDLNWRVLSGNIVAESSVYVYDPRNVEVIKKGAQVTKIPTEAVVVLVVMTVAIIVIRVAVYWALERGDNKPQLNVVDGVSSIGREELMQTGRSGVRGEPMMVGFRQKGNAMLHFGPLANPDDAVKVIKGVDIL